MKNVRFVGLDVHKESIVVAVAEGDRSEPQVVAELPNDTARLLKELRKLSRGGAELGCCYEAGPTGFGVHRALRDAGIECVVIAPSLIPKQAGVRVKTDRRDAVKLARFHRSGDLTPIHVPDTSTEAMRDLERAREDAKNAECIGTPPPLRSFCFARAFATRKAARGETLHMAWIRAQQFVEEAHNRVLVDCVHAVEHATDRVARLDKDIAELVESWSLKPIVEALQGLRGIRLLSAVVIVAELGGSVERFATPKKLMAYLGLVPSEHSSGESTRRGGITRTGNQHVRRILVEAAWSYRFRPATGDRLKAQNRRISPSVIAVAWKAQHRLHDRYRRLLARGKNEAAVDHRRRSGAEAPSSAGRSLGNRSYSLPENENHERRAVKPTDDGNGQGESSWLPYGTRPPVPNSRR